MAEILIVEDDLANRKMLRFVLEQLGGHHVHEAATSDDVEASPNGTPFDLVLLDVMMPSVDGFEVCRRLRSRSNVPIIFVSALGDIGSRVRALQLGGDDYMTKPFDPSELSARIEAVLRRAQRSPRADCEGRMRVGSLTINLAEHRVEVRSDRGGSRGVQLTPTEFKLLLVLARSPGRAFTRKELQESLWGAGVDGGAGSNTLNAYVSELRERLEVDPHKPRFLLTVRGVGYKLDP